MCLVPPSWWCERNWREREIPSRRRWEMREERSEWEENTRVQSFSLPLCVWECARSLRQLPARTHFHSLSLSLSHSESFSFLLSLFLPGINYLYRTYSPYCLLYSPVSVCYLSLWRACAERERDSIAPSRETRKREREREAKKCVSDDVIMQWALD